MSRADGAIRIVTWNIHGAVGADRRCDLDRVVAILRVLDPDIAAVQEVDGRAWAGRKPRAFERLGEALGFQVAEARLTGRGDLAYGHLLWSRWPILSTQVRRLPGGRIEPRAAIDAVVATPLGSLRVLATHFGLAPNDRAAQARSLAAISAESSHPTVALGDFNEWRRAGPVHRFLGAALPQLAARPTWPARRPLVTMDRIYASATIALSEIEAAKEASAASDHLPLVATMRLQSA